jgi:hypothetical protein
MKFSNDSYSIGEFGDFRRKAAGAALFRAIFEKGELIVRRLSRDRAEQVRFERFLWSDAVTVEEIAQNAFNSTAELARDVEHVLCFQDTTEIDLSSRENDLDKNGIGCLKSRDASGFYIHPALSMDAKDDFVIGLSSFLNFDYGRIRQKYVSHIEAKKPIEQKKSFRWIECAEESKVTLSQAKKVTMIGDRENDFYEYFVRVPSENFHILVRSKGERAASLLTEQKSDAKEISQVLKKFRVVGKRTIEVPARAAVLKGPISKRREARTSREAHLEIKYGRCFLYRGETKDSSYPERIEMTVVEAKEIVSDNSDAKEQIHWILLTSHQPKSLDEAWDVVSWYKKRWNIEQLFRTAKKGGMQLNEIEVSKGPAIKKLCFLGLLASVRILQLTLCREGKIVRPANTTFNETEIKLLGAAHKQYEGKTEKQKNPHKKNTMAWSYWIIARMGGWKGYVQSEGPAGPTTLKRGIDELHNLVRGWLLYKDVCTT